MKQGEISSQTACGTLRDKRERVDVQACRFFSLPSASGITKSCNHWSVNLTIRRSIRGVSRHSSS